MIEPQPAIAISARNRWAGTVAALTRGVVNSEVVVVLPTGEQVVAIVTNESVAQLELAPGRPVTALVKASSVLLAPGEIPPRTSARNCYCGHVSSYREGAINGEVVVTVPGGIAVTAVVTNDSIRRLGLVPPAPACALVKATSVLLAVNG